MLNPPPSRHAVLEMATWKHRLMLLSTSLSVLAIGLIGSRLAAHAEAVDRQTRPEPNRQPIQSASQSQNRSQNRSQEQPQLWVNPQTGNDATADGSEQAPFRTLTRALEQARSQTVIQLLSGTYSEQTGEVFPILLKPGVTVQGNPDALGSGITIQGNGSYQSPSLGRQNVTVVGAHQAILSGITITNPALRGQGVWLETGSAILQNNTITGNAQTGVMVAGSSSAQLDGNLFLLNRSSGLTVAGSAQPTIQRNRFQRTTTGIVIRESAAPQILSNRLSQNRDGIVVQDQARPVLRDNTIEDSERDGLLVIAQAQPNLGTPQQPGNNVFLNNQQQDIDALAASQAVSAFGNQLTASQTIGKIDLTGSAASRTAMVASIGDRLPLNASPALVTHMAPARTTVARTITAQTLTPQPAMPLAESPIAQSPPATAPVLISSLPPTSVTRSNQSQSNQSQSNQSQRTQSQSPTRTAAGTVVAASIVNRSSASQNVTQSTSNLAAVAIPVPAPETAASIDIPVPSPERSTLTARSVARSDNRSATARDRSPAEQSALRTANRSAANSPTLQSRSLSSSANPAAPQPRSVSSPAPVAAAPISPRSIALTVPPPETSVANHSTNAAANQPVNWGQAVATSMQQFSNVVVTAVASLPRQAFPTNMAPRLSGTPIAIPVPPPDRNSTATRSTAPDPNARVLPVPGAEIPIGNTDGVDRISVANASLATAYAQRASLQYRVVVPAPDPVVQTQVQAIVPGAFSMVLNGRSVMQVGAFSSEQNAQEAVAMLSRNGFQGIIQPMN